MPEVSTQKDNKIEPMTVEQFQARLNSDSAFMNAYLKNPAEYEAAITDLGGKTQTDPAPAVASAPQAPSPAAPQGQPSAESQAQQNQPDEEVTVTIPKRLLGSYVVNRTPQEGLVEALKGIQEKDTLISMLRQRGTEDHGEKMSLREQLAKFKGQGQAGGVQSPPSTQPAAAPAAPSQPAPSEVTVLDIDDLPEDESLFEPTNVKKLVAANKAMRKLLLKTAEDVSTTKKTTEELASQRVAQETAARQQAERDAALRKEFEMIQDLQREVPELRTSVPFQELDRAVVQFIQDVGYIAGTGNGEYNAAAIAAASRFFNDKTPAGEELRRKVTESGIRPPEEIERHGEIIRVRQERQRAAQEIRRQLEERTGRKFEDHEVPVPLTYTEAYRRLRPQSQAQSVLAARIAGAQQVAHATVPNQFAREVPPEAAHTDVALESIPAEQISALLSKPSRSYTGTEARLMERWYKSQDVPVPDEVLRRAKIT